MTMTNREFFGNIINGVINDEIVDKAKEELAKLDSRNAKRADAKSAKRATEYEPIEKSILDSVDGTMTTAEIASVVGLSVNKVSPRCKALVEKGYLVESEVKIPKVGVRKAYAKA